MPDRKHKSRDEQSFSNDGQEPAKEATPIEASGPTTEELQAKLTESQAKVQEYLDALQRERADFTNYRRRVELENSQLSRLISGTTIKKFLAVLDDLERALANRPAEDVWANGIELVYRKFQSILEAEGVTPIQAVGQPFDPNLHEAIMQEPSDAYLSGTVTAVLQQGYMHGDRVLRHALVKVAQ